MQRMVVCTVLGLIVHATGCTSSAPPDGKIYQGGLGGWVERSINFDLIRSDVPGKDFVARFSEVPDDDYILYAYVPRNESREALVTAKVTLSTSEGAVLMTEVVELHAESNSNELGQPLARVRLERAVKYEIRAQTVSATGDLLSYSLSFVAIRQKWF